MSRIIDQLYGKTALVTDRLLPDCRTVHPVRASVVDAMHLTNLTCLLLALVAWIWEQVL